MGIIPPFYALSSKACLQPVFCLSHRHAPSEDIHSYASSDAKEDLQCLMAKDVVTIRNETLNFNRDKNCMENLSGGIEGSMLTDMSSDFQKKVTSTKHDKGDNEAGFLYGNDETYQKMAGMFEFSQQLIKE
ncbi:hypothetical protein VNO78_19979 [Psophocarpus tetragonolobus]|uniref:Uncharacterized protein n=1 Tax=Psophocarpus tetragonolobus TaxID=3891 RepID=A0AAN9SCJ3_PSOTE